jgi:hypothetical protein
LLRDERVRKQIRETAQKALVVLGTDDMHFDAAFLATLRTVPQVEAIVLEGADHSLEFKGDLLKSINLMEEAMRGMRQFFAASSQ